MATFNVYFMGLVCHVGDDSMAANPREKKHAVLINETSHHAAAIRFVPSEITNPGHAVIPLTKGAWIEFDPADLAPGTAAADRLFEDTIPGLKMITGGADLDSDIKNARADDDALAYLKYPKGKLTVSAFYPYKVIYVLNGHGVGQARCVGRVVHFTAATDKTRVHVTINNGGSPIVVDVDANGSMCVLNVTPHQGNDHLKFHQRLTNSPIVANAFASNQECPSGSNPPCVPKEIFDRAHEHRDRSDERSHIKMHPAAGLDPECSNSQWP